MSRYRERLDNHRNQKATYSHGKDKNMRQNVTKAKFIILQLRALSNWPDSFEDKFPNV